MAEWVELGRVEFTGQHSESIQCLDNSFLKPLTTKSQLIVLELGASTSLPSLLAATSEHPPSFVLTTDYPDEAIIT
jgi:hypothetical protein